MNNLEESCKWWHLINALDELGYAFSWAITAKQFKDDSITTEIPQKLKKSLKFYQNELESLMLEIMPEHKELLTKNILKLKKDLETKLGESIKLVDHDLGKQVKEILKEAKKKLKEIPSDLEKAEGFLLAHTKLPRSSGSFLASPFVYFIKKGQNDELREGLDRLIAQWQEEYEFFETKYNEYPLQPKYFWDSDHLLSFEADIERILLKEWLELDRFEKAYKELMETVEVNITKSMWFPMSSEGYLPRLGTQLYYASRTKFYKHRLQPILHYALGKLVEAQDTSGTWGLRYDYPEKKSYTIYVVDTATASIALARFGKTEEEKNAAKNAAKWLMNCQEPEGYWKTTIPPAKSSNASEYSANDIETTCLVMQALAATGVDQAQKRISKAKRWLMDRQNSLGGWWDPSNEVSPIYLTILVLETIQMIETPPHRLDDFPYLPLAKQLLDHGITHSFLDNDNDLALSVFSLHQALEFFIYACLEQEGISIYSRPNRTKGLVVGLVDSNLLNNGNIPERSFIDEIISFRNGIVHHGGTVPASKCREFVEKTWDFFHKYMEQIFDIDIKLL